MVNWNSIRGFVPNLTRHRRLRRISNSNANDILPNKFDLNRAIELMQLSEYTYEQFDYFKSNGNVDGWVPSNASYSIEKTLYTYEKINNVISKLPIGFIVKKEKECV